MCKLTLTAQSEQISKNETLRKYKELLLNYTPVNSFDTRKFKGEDTFESMSESDFDK